MGWELCFQLAWCKRIHFGCHLTDPPLISAAGSENNTDFIGRKSRLEEVFTAGGVKPFPLWGKKALKRPIFLKCLSALLCLSAGSVLPSIRPGQHLMNPPSALALIASLEGGKLSPGAGVSLLPHGQGWGKGLQRHFQEWNEEVLQQPEHSLLGGSCDSQAQTFTALLLYLKRLELKCVNAKA